MIIDIAKGLLSIYLAYWATYWVAFAVVIGAFFTLAHIFL